MIRKTVSLDDIISNSDLLQRPRRPARHEDENLALASLVEAMADSPTSVLDSLARAILTLTQAHSAGVSLEDVTSEGGLFRWQAVAGDHSRCVGSTFASQASPCGAVIERNEALLLAHPATCYPELAAVSPPIAEMLLVPFCRDERPMGTVWAISRDASKKFDAEDLRLLKSLSRVACTAMQALKSIKAAERADIAETKRNEQRLRLLCRAAETLLTADEPDEMLHTIFSQFSNPIGVDTYFNFMVSEGGEGLWLASCSGVPEGDIEKIGRLKFGQAACGTAAERRQPLVASNIQSSNDSMFALIRSYGIRAYACNPLLAGDRLLGTLSFATRSRDEFAPPELEFFRTIASFVTAAYVRLELIGRLRQGDRRKDEFLAMLAHELRNPLAAIGNAVKLVSSPQPEKHLDWSIAVISRQLHHLSRLIDDLMDVSRITRGKITLQRKVYDIADILKNVSAATESLVLERGHSLNVDTIPGAFWVNGDITRLEQIFVNLVTNAAKYSEPGGTIQIQAHAHAGYVLVSVIDSGVGIPSDLIREIFDLFSQGDRSLARSEGGLGVGLTIVQKLAELHGGSVSAKSEGPGKGSEFIVKLPLSEPAHAPSVASPPSSQRTSSLRILVVDDNTDMATGLEKILDIAGHNVTVAHSGVEALEIIDKAPPHVILLDIGLPGMSGYEVAKKLRTSPIRQNLTIIAVSGYGQEGDRTASREAGIDLHMTKPVDYDELLKVLASVSADSDNAPAK